MQGAGQWGNGPVQTRSMGGRPRGSPRVGTSYSQFIAGQDTLLPPQGAATRGVPGAGAGSLLGPEPDHTSLRGFRTSAWRTLAPASSPTHSPDLVRGLRVHLDALPKEHRQHPGPHLKRWGIQGEGRGLSGEPRTRGYTALRPCGPSSPWVPRGPPHILRAWAWSGSLLCGVPQEDHPGTAAWALERPPHQGPLVPRHLHVGLWYRPLPATPGPQHAPGARLRALGPSRGGPPSCPHASGCNRVIFAPDLAWCCPRLRVDRPPHLGLRPIHREEGHSSMIVLRKGGICPGRGPEAAPSETGPQSCPLFYLHCSKCGPLLPPAHQPRAPALCFPLVWGEPHFPAVPRGSRMGEGHVAAPVTRVTSGPRVKSPIANRSFWGGIQHGGLLASLRDPQFSWKADGPRLNVTVNP